MKSVLRIERVRLPTLWFWMSPLKLKHPSRSTNHQWLSSSWPQLFAGNVYCNPIWHRGDFNPLALIDGHLFIFFLSKPVTNRVKFRSVLEKISLANRLKVAFFQKVWWNFFRAQISKKKYSKKLSWAWNLNFPPITLY